jgi:hypothetical protein
MFVEHRFSASLFLSLESKTRKRMLMQWKGKTGKMSQGPKFCLQTQGRERAGTTPTPSPQLHRHYTAAQLHDCLPSPTSSSLPSVSSIPPLFSKDSWFFFNPVVPLTKKPNYTNYYYYYPPQKPYL